MTVDIDRYNDVKNSITSIGFKENIDFFAIVEKESGKEFVEGLIPSARRATLLSSNPKLTIRALMSRGKDQYSSKSE